MYIFAICGEDGHIDEGGTKVEGDLYGDGIEVVGANESVTSVDEEDAVEDDEEDEGADDGFEADSAISGAGLG